MKITLLGFMGTGKSTVGPLVAERLAVPFLDTDELIVEKAGQSIPEIFANRGEEYFRTLEKQVLAETIEKRSKFVLATGGGIVIAEENRKLLKKDTFPVLLTASPEEIYRRVAKEGERPLLEVENPEERIAELLVTRRDYYNSFSRRIDTGNKTPEEICKEIISLFREESGVDMENIIKNTRE
ncbi:MAG: shikimate kinase [Bacillota bacterium]